MWWRVPSGYATAWPAVVFTGPRQKPPYSEASASPARASRSPPSRTALVRKRPTRRDALERVKVDQRMRLAARIGLDAMRQSVDARRGRDRRRHRRGQVGVDDGEIGQHVPALHRELVLRRRIGDEGARAGLAAGAGRGRDLDQSDAPAGHLLGSDNLMKRLSASRQHRHELGKIHGAAAAEADNEIGPGLLGQGQRALQVRDVGLGLHLAENRDGSGQIEAGDPARIEGIRDH